jgi:hypothetical protein
MNKETFMTKLENKENLNINNKKKKAPLNKPNSTKTLSNLEEKKEAVNKKEKNMIEETGFRNKIKIEGEEAMHDHQIDPEPDDHRFLQNELSYFLIPEEALEGNQCVNDMNIYLDKENCILLKNFGSEIYNYIREMESSENISSLLNKTRHISEIRTKMVDWMIEVLSVYKSDNTTFFLAVYILDKFISKVSQPVRSDEIHLLGMTSMFIASKFEDVIPIRIQSMVSKIGHNTFSE